MIGQWRELKSRFEAFAVRERLLMVGALVAVVYLLWDFLLLQPINADTKILIARERVAKQNLLTADAEITVLTALAGKDPNIALQRDLAELQTKLKALDTQLDTLAVGLVPANKLPAVMHDVLRQTGKLQLLSMTTLPPEEIIIADGIVTGATPPNSAGSAAPAEIAAESATSIQNVKIYKHGVALNVTGGFAELVLYLTSLERGGWRFYWESLHYQVTAYPTASAKLKVFTLSSQRGILDGV